MTTRNSATKNKTDFSITKGDKIEQPSITLTHENYAAEIVGWAADKGIYSHTTISTTKQKLAQLTKVISETVEINSAMVMWVDPDVDADREAQSDAVIDAIGDTLVTLIILDAHYRSFDNSDSDIFDESLFIFTEYYLDRKLASDTDVEDAHGALFKSLDILSSEVILHAGDHEKDDSVYNAIETHCISVFDMCIVLDLEPFICLQTAYEVIALRTGITVNGVFVKSEDLIGGKIYNAVEL